MSKVTQELAVVGVNIFLSLEEANRLYALLGQVAAKQDEGVSPTLYDTLGEAIGKNFVYYTAKIDEDRSCIRIQRG